MIKQAFRNWLRRIIIWATAPEAPRRDFSRNIFAYPLLNALVEDAAAALGAQQRPHYTWGLAHAAYLAKNLGSARITAIELGVAGGSGLIALDRTAGWIERALGVGIDVVGFDSGQGLPKPEDYRDLPNLWAQGDFAMNERALRTQLQRAQLNLGLVEATIPEFLASDHAPIGFISFDLDLYSSTIPALALLEASPERILPRVQCYFDDILGFSFADFNGERLAIHEFNAAHDRRKISPIYGARFYVPARYASANWTEKLFLAHILDHPRYNDHDGLVRNPQLAIDQANSPR
jgi:hypothetical protein